MCWSLLFVILLLSAASVTEILSNFPPEKVIRDFAQYYQLPPAQAYPDLGLLCFDESALMPSKWRDIRSSAGSRVVMSYSTLERLHWGGNFARTLINSLPFDDSQWFIVPDYPCADVWVFRSFPPRNFPGVLVFSDAERNFRLSGFPFLFLHPLVVYLGPPTFSGFARQIFMPFASSHFAQREDPTAMLELLRPSRSRVPLAEKRKFAGYLARNCVEHREEAFARLCTIGDCEALGKCGRIDQSEKGEKIDQSRYEDFYLDRAVEMFRMFKFVLVFENAIDSGYVTEKIVAAFLAGAVPIYWGDLESVNKIFDPRAFVAASADENWLEQVRRLNENLTEYENMRGIVPVIDPHVFSWRKEMGGHALGKEIVQSIKETLEIRKMIDLKELAISDNALLAVTEIHSLE